ncbi:MAG TPA: lysylphosphatidylglycerol synthase domain-containing protein [Burkholderiales bacterium]|nr:lysylphosphatidylglycerol synthase domain-containing protein [Burkholderiales bacterium]
MRSVIASMLRLSVSLSIIAVILSRVSIRDMLARAASGAPLYLAGALALMLLSIVLVALRWRLLARWLGMAMSIGLAVRALFLAVFGGQVLPSALGADVLRGWLLARKTNGVARVVASLVADRLVALFAACLLLLISDRAVARLLPMFAPYVAPLAVLGVGAILLVFLAGLRRVSVLDAPARQAKPLLLAIAIAVVVQGAAVVTAALVATAYSMNGTLALWVSVVPLSVIISSIPISVNGWGVREATIVALAAPLGVPPTDALLVSVTLGALNVLASLPGALVMLAGRAA